MTSSAMASSAYESLPTQKLNLQDPQRLKNLLKSLPPITIIPRAVATSSFTFFPNLPNEIKNKIWKFVAHQPRDIKIYDLVNVMHINTATDFFEAGPKIAGQYPTPPLLHVCQHSRAEGLLYYEALLERNIVSRGGLGANQFFGISPPSIKPLSSTRDIVYANFAVDRFVCVPRECVRMNVWYEMTLEHLNFDKEIMDKVQHIAYVHRGPARFDSLSDLRSLLKLKTVANLTVILRDCGAAGFGETLWGDIIRRHLLSLVEYDCQHYNAIPHSLEWEKPEEEAVDLEPCQAPVFFFGPDGREIYLAMVLSVKLWRF